MFIAHLLCVFHQNICKMQSSHNIQWRNVIILFGERGNIQTETIFELFRTELTSNFCFFCKANAFFNGMCFYRFVIQILHNKHSLCEHLQLLLSVNSTENCRIHCARKCKWNKQRIKVQKNKKKKQTKYSITANKWIFHVFVLVTHFTKLPNLF